MMREPEDSTRYNTLPLQIGSRRCDPGVQMRKTTGQASLSPKIGSRRCDPGALRARWGRRLRAGGAP